MSEKIFGNTRGLAPSQVKKAERLYRRRLDRDEIVSVDLARELLDVARELGRRVGLLITREGEVEMVIVGTREILYLPDLGRYRLGRGRLRRLRLLFSDLGKSEHDAVIPHDIYTDLEKLRLDAVMAVKLGKNRVSCSYAHLSPQQSAANTAVLTEKVPDLGKLELDFGELMESVEGQLAELRPSSVQVSGRERAVVIGVYPKGFTRSSSSLNELLELARSAGVEVLDKIVQFRDLDPRTLIGKGKLEEVVLHCLRLEAGMLIFDTELKPAQWRTIINLTELKVIDRSMLILDIFAQRASSSEGRLQVELAQLKYNLPRLTEQDSGLSRLSGGIGGRGPGETKLEISRRRVRDKIAALERKIEQLRSQRELRRKQQRNSGVPVVSLIGYTNAGKSSLFNQITKATVLVENKLFATLDPARRRVVLTDRSSDDTAEQGGKIPLVLADTVGFIRDLPEELSTAFRATIEEIGESSLILHVLDASDPDCFDHKRAVEGVLEQLGYSNIPRILVFNKCDLLSPEQRASLLLSCSGLMLSSLRREGFEQLFEDIVREIKGAAGVSPQELPEESEEGEP